MSDIMKKMPASYISGGATVLMSAPYSFLRAPYVALERKEIEKAGAKAAFLGVPFESGNFSRPGSSWGPKALRIASEQLSNYFFEYDLDLFEFYNLIDCGDIAVVPPDIRRTMENVERGVYEIASAGAMPLICGGDHSIPIGSIKALSKATKGKLGYIHFDAHMDTAEEVANSQFSSCSPVTRAIDYSGLSPKNIAMIGIRGTLNPPGWLQAVKKHGLRMYTMPEIWERGIVDIAKESLDIAGEGTDAIYVSVDADSLDASVAPGTTCPEPYGITSKEIIQAMRTLGSHSNFEKVKAIDVMELCPQYDLSGITAYLLCSIIVNFLAAKAKSLKER